MEFEESTGAPAGRAQTGGSLLEYIESNPVSAVIQALAVGFAVGMLIRLLGGSQDRDKGIDVKKKPTLDDAKFHLGSLILPFLWPAWQKTQEKYGQGAETLRDTLESLKKKDLPKEARKRLKEAEQWAEKEAEELAEIGKGKARDLEKWVEDEILPAAECGWKKVRKFFG